MFSAGDRQISGGNPRTGWKGIFMWSEKDTDGILKPGTVFEKYTVEKMLGRGGMGCVYLVRHNVLDSFFALKVLFPRAAEKNKLFIDRFLQEAKLACKIRHPNLIAVYDAGRNPDNGLYYLVMDDVPGGSVRDLLDKERRLDLALAVRTVKQTAQALTAAYEHHMVHRDIKPDNIMFDADGTAKLADLGIAKLTDNQEITLTASHSVFGTPAYMSPEQARDSSKVDSRADIYSLGIVFYEMLTGRRPYRGDSAIEVLSQVLSDADIPDIRKIRPTIPAELAELILEMTAKNLEKRIPDPATLLQRLEKINISSIDQQQVDYPIPDECSGHTSDIGKKSVGSSSNGIDRTQVMPGGKTAASPEKRESPAARKLSGKSPLRMASPSIADHSPNEDLPAESPSEKKSAHSVFNLCIAAGAAVCFGLVLVCAFLLFPSNGNKTTKANVTAPNSVLPVIPQKTKSEITGPVREVPAKIQSDPMSRNQVILLAGPSDFSQTVKSILIEAFGKEKVSFQQAESLSRSREKLNSIIRSSPSVVILACADKYLKDRISGSSFENLIQNHADQLRGKGIPLLFVLAPETENDRQVRAFNQAAVDVCKMRSIPLIRNVKQQKADFIKTIQILEKR